MTLGLPKAGLLTKTGRSASGKLYLADMGLPAALYARIGLTVEPLFSSAPIVRLED